jgi:HAD superfamily hydrolase (TIGR01490 family)
MERKAFLLKPYRGKSQQFFSQKGEFFFNEIIQKRLYLELIHLIKEHQKKGDDVVVISGGLSIYLSFFVKAYHIKSYFATDLEFENDLFTGKIHGRECLGEEKVARLNKQINLELYDLEQSVVYTDHESDLPLLNLVGKGVIVKRNQDVSWRSENHSVMQIN